MNLIQLKVPPDKLALIIGAIERDLDINRADQDAAALQDILNWMRYRLTRWNAHHPDPAPE